MQDVLAWHQYCLNEHAHLGVSVHLGMLNVLTVLSVRFADSELLVWQLSKQFHSKGSDDHVWYCFTHGPKLTQVRGLFSLCMQ